MFATIEFSIRPGWIVLVMHLVAVGGLNLGLAQSFSRVVCTFSVSPQGSIANRSEHLAYSGFGRTVDDNCSNKDVPDLHNIYLAH
eukprot:812951-Amphidinium_carterae.1